MGLFVNPFLHYIILRAVHILNISQSDTSHHGNVSQVKVIVVKQVANQLVGVEINVSHFSYLFRISFYALIIAYLSRFVKALFDFLLGFRSCSSGPDFYRLTPWLGLGLTP